MTDACTVAVTGMSCGACATRLERVLARVPGVEDVTVDFATGKALLRRDPALARDEDLAAAASVAGFGLEAADDPDPADASRTEASALLARVAIAAFLSMNAMMLSVGLYFGDPEPTVARVLAWGSGLFAAPAIVVGGGPLFRGALASLRERSPGAELLIALGATLAFALSVAMLAAGRTDVYFDTAAILVTLHVAGKALEARIRARATDATRALLDRAPRRVHLVDGGGETEVDVEAVPIGALVRIRPGERLPVDGVVETGRSSVDRSILTGESLPVAVAPGDVVHAGEVNADGSLLVRVTATVGLRRLDRVAAAVRDLLGQRTPVQRAADAVAGRLVPALLAVAVLSGAGWWLATGDAARAVLVAVSVIVVTCPCALGVAAPLAVAAAAGRAGSRGILFRDAEAIERAAAVDAVWFDKTGTLTLGAPRVVGVDAAPGVSSAELLARASSVEAASEHPLARALRAAAPDAPPAEPIVAVPGSGVEHEGPDGVTRAGAARWLVSLGVPVPEPGPSAHTEVHVALDDRWLGRILLGDAVSPDAPATIARLRAAGLDLGLLTGDGAAVAASVAREVGFAPAEVHAALSPEEKAARIAAGGHRRVAYVGDGLNDGPALAGAWLGVATTGAVDVARAASHVLLLDGGAARVPEMLDLASRTQRVIRQNLAWAVGYNLLAVPLAVAGVASPLVAALAMTLSSLTVTLNAARLAADRP